MKAPLSWINQMTKVNVSPKTFADKMTLSGSKVEALIELGESLKNVVVGQVIDIKDHENSDHLHVLRVDVGDETLQIVCGAPNVTLGMKCPVAKVGAMLPGGFEIKKAKLRGVESFGMCCAADELGFDKKDFVGADTDGLWVLEEEALTGQSFSTHLGVDEVVIDFEITSNRPDCFSIEGLAREAAITLDQPFNQISPVVRGEGKGQVDQLARIDILAPDLCYRYCSRVVEDVHIKPSPAWMQNQLRAAGVRPINNFVDITNFVCIEMGQPMHAFDLFNLSGQHIIVRTAKDGESIETLDGVSRTLDASMLVIADETKACAIAGVMGASNSEVTDETRTILFESACFSPTSVRKTATANGLRTEASSRYEKGLDPENALRALDRACELVERLGCGKVCRDVIDVYPTKLPVPEIFFSVDKVNELLGTALDEAFMIDILEKVGCKLVAKDSGFICTPPTYRPDLLVLADLAEEVARFYDYNNIEPTMLSGKQTTLGGRSKYQTHVEVIKDALISQGFYEAMTYSFESPKELDKLMLPVDDVLRRQVVITNPLGEDFSVMRTSMAPSMLRIAGRNSSRAVVAADVFELAYTYLPTEENLLPTEQHVVSAMCYDLGEDEERATSFFKMKGAVVSLCGKLGISDPDFIPTAEYSFMHPGRTCDVFFGQEKIGYFGYVHPEVARRFEAPVSTVLLSLEVSKLSSSAQSQKKYESIPKYPGISRDLALIVDRSIMVGDLRKSIIRNGGTFLTECELFDVYQGKQIADHLKSVAFSIYFQSPERTLSDSDIKSSVDQILSKLEKDFGAVLR